MDTTELVRMVAEQRGLAVSLTFDPSADDGERWVASIGLNAMGAGSYPIAALGAALVDLDGEGRQALATCDAKRHGWASNPLEPDVTDRHYRREHGL
jgi:hypothetical protein